MSEGKRGGEKQKEIELKRKKPLPNGVYPKQGNTGGTIGR